MQDNSYMQDDCYINYEDKDKKYGLPPLCG